MEISQGGEEVGQGRKGDSWELLLANFQSPTGFVRSSDVSCAPESWYHLQEGNSGYYSFFMLVQVTGKKLKDPEV